jgi:hypothetical protein
MANMEHIEAIEKPPRPQAWKLIRQRRESCSLAEVEDHYRPPEFDAIDLVRMVEDKETVRCPAKFRLRKE